MHYIRRFGFEPVKEPGLGRVYRLGGGAFIEAAKKLRSVHRVRIVALKDEPAVTVSPANNFPSPPEADEAKEAMEE